MNHINSDTNSNIDIEQCCCCLDNINKVNNTVTKCGHSIHLTCLQNSKRHDDNFFFTFNLVVSAKKPLFV